MEFPSANENAFLGAIVGSAIGDALGLPVDGLSADDIRERYGLLDAYLDVEGMPEGQPTKGVISDKTEVMLAIIESLTTNDAMVDAENIIARMRFIVESPSRLWISDALAIGVEAAFANDGVAPPDTSSTPEAAVSARGLPIGLLHSIGELDREALIDDARAVTRLSHADDASALLVAQVAEAMSFAARYVDRDAAWAEHLTIRTEHPLSARINEVVEGVAASTSFEDAVLPVVRGGGEAAAFGAIAGGLAGGVFGAAGLPQQFIDDLDARIYLSMAAPWFYRTVLRRHGVVVDLHLTDQFPQ